MTLTLETLSLDVLIGIAILLDPPDVIHLRMTSRRLRDLSYERVILVMLYGAYRLTLPIGPLPAQTRQVLEKSLVTSYATHQNLFVTHKLPHSRIYDTGNKVHFEVTGRWALSRNPEGTRVLCYDLDLQQHEVREPTTAWQIDEDEFRIWTKLCQTVTLYDGRKLSLVLLELRTKDLVQYAMGGSNPPRGTGANTIDSLTTKIVILKMTSGGVLALEELYRLEHVIHSSRSRLLATLSPTALTVQWAGDPKEAFVWDTEKLDMKPVTISHRHATPDKYVLYTCTGTHVISRRSSLAILGTVIEATPLQTVLSDTTYHPTAVGNMPGSMFIRVTVLRDSVVDPVTGFTEIVLLGLEQPGLRNNGDPSLLVVRLLIPPAPETDRRPSNIEIHLQALMNVPLESQTMHINTAWNGSIRMAYLRHIYATDEDEENGAPTMSYPNRERKMLGIVEITYEEDTRSATMLAARDVSLPVNVQDILNQRATQLEYFETELGSGRLVYRTDLGSYQSPLRKLGVLDFA